MRSFLGVILLATAIAAPATAGDGPAGATGTAALLEKRRVTLNMDGWTVEVGLDHLRNMTDINFVVDNVIANAVPEPSTLILLTSGAGLLGLSRWRSQRLPGSTYSRSSRSRKQPYQAGPGSCS